MLDVRKKVEVNTILSIRNQLQKSLSALLKKKWLRSEYQARPDFEADLGLVSCSQLACVIKIHIIYLHKQVFYMSCHKGFVHIILEIT